MDGIEELKGYFRIGNTVTISNTFADINIQGIDRKILIENHTLYEKEQTKKMMPGDVISLGGYECMLGRGWISISPMDQGVETGLESIARPGGIFQGFPQYKRSPRMLYKSEQSEVSIKKAPEKKKIGKGSLAGIILPPLMMAGVSAGISLLLGRGMYIVLSLAGTAMTLAFSVMKFIQEKKENTQSNQENERIYEEYLLRQRKKIYEAYEKERKVYTYHYPNLGVLQETVERYDKRIYEKTCLDDDFLCVSLGGRSETALCKIKVEGEEDLKGKRSELEQDGLDLKKEFSTTKDKPVVVDFKKEYVGLIGDKKTLHEQIKLILMQLGVFHSYHELEIIVIYGDEATDEFSYLKWLPHVTIHGINALGTINSERKRDQVLGSVYQMLKERKKRVEEHSKDSMFLPWFLFVIEEPKFILEHPIMEFLEAKNEGLCYSILYASTMKGRIPENIGSVILLETPDQGKVSMRGRQEVSQSFQLQRMGDTSLEWMCRNLSSLEHVKGMVNQIPEQITFFDLYQIQKPEELEVGKRWDKSKTEKSLAVPLGVRGKEDYVMLNLHEKAHGPHGLVAGTTGSGKSEIVQSYILSLAVNFSPYDVGFLLIDYKGGGMADLFSDLPHLLGTITNLDGSEGLRALVSIKSELSRRQRVLSAHGVNHISGYGRLFREGKAKEPMPHLFLISDEFAELKKEQPEFMSELVSAARIGRSLGIHLILATQKPSGVVDDQIWSNSKFKLALKVQNESDSKEILKTPDAASIVQPGRAYLQVGNNEIYELFQSAWSGAAFRQESAGKEEIDDRIYLVNELGQGELINQDLSDEEGEKGSVMTQLDAIVSHIKEVAKGARLKEVARPWLPPLGKKIINQEEVKQQETRLPNLIAKLGEVDIPEEQTKAIYSIDFTEDGNVFYGAASGYGKTTFLTNLILSLAIKNDVAGLNFYLLDFGNSGLIPLNALHHTAEYITMEDGEKLKKFITLIEQEMVKRKKLLAKAMVQNFSVYNKSTENVMKGIVIAIDNYDVIKEVGYEMEEFVKKVSRDGAGLGIYMVVTAGRSSVMKYNTLSNFKNKIAGFLFEEADVSAIVGRSTKKQTDIKGRCLVKHKGMVSAMQGYVITDYEDETTYNKGVERVIREINALYPDSKAERIAVLPESLGQKELMKYPGGEGVRVGLHKERVEAVCMDPFAALFIILGESGRGKTNLLQVMLSQIEEPVYLFDSPTMELYGYSERENVRYIDSEEKMEDFREKVSKEVEARSKWLKEEISLHPGTSPKELASSLSDIYIVVDEWDSFVERVGKSGADYAQLMQAGNAVGVKVIISAEGGKLKGFDELNKYAKGGQNGMLLGSSGSSGLFSLKSNREAPAFKEGLLFRGSHYDRVMLAKSIGAIGD